MYIPVKGSRVVPETMDEGPWVTTREINRDRDKAKSVVGEMRGEAVEGAVR